MSTARPIRLGREAVSLTLAPLTVGRLAKLSEMAGMSRGRLVDIALANLEVCEACNGSGLETESSECPDCRGHRVVPTS